MCKVCLIIVLSNKLYITMTTRLLFPYRFRLIGWLIFVPFALLGLAYLYADFQLDWLVIPRLNKLTRIVTSMSETNLTEVQNLTDEVAGIGVIVGLLFVAFSREKTEDEMSTVLRLEAL